MLSRNKRTEIQGVVGADGTVTVSVSVPLGPSWEIRQIGVTSTSELESSCRTYIGINSSGVFISQSFTANSDTDSEPNVTLRPGDSLCCVWETATVGSLCTLTIIYDEVRY